jgi:transposase
MPQSHAPYAPEFRQQLIELVRAGRSPEQLSEEFGCSAQSIRNWVAQAAIDEGKPLPGTAGLTTAEREELTRLRRENRQLKMERDILAKATAWFAGKNGSSSNS